MYRTPVVVAVGRSTYCIVVETVDMMAHFRSLYKMAPAVENPVERPDSRPTKTNLVGRPDSWPV